jgi:hypothetical protein
VSLSDFICAAFEAYELLAAHPFRWLVVTVAFLLFVEGLMLIPFVGFTLKLAAAGILSAQFLVIFKLSDAGTLPTPFAFADALSFSFDSLLVLAVTAFAPFALAIVFLRVYAGSSAIRFFFSNIFTTKPPPARAFAISKYVMLFVALPFTLLAGVVAMTSSTGIDALRIAVFTAWEHWLPVLLIALIALAYETAVPRLTSRLPSRLAIVFDLVCLVGFVAWNMAITYTVSKQIFLTTASRV